MAFPPAFLDELRARLPLSEVAARSLRLTRAGREFKACCPFHNEKSPSFYINDDKQFFHCFGCGAHGDVIGFTMRQNRLSFPEAIEALASQAGLPVPQNSPVEREKYDKEKRLLQLLDRATAWFEEQLYTPTGRMGLQYFKQRGLNEDSMRRFHLGYAPQDAQALIRKMTSENFTLDEMLAVGLIKKSDERNDHYSFFRNRVMFPVGDSRGRTVAFGARILGDGEPKYLNSPDHPMFHKGKLLYGLSRARAALGANQPLIVVEGYMDVIALVEAGFTGAVAPLGTALTEDQMIALWKLLPPLEVRNHTFNYDPILCFDGDNAGWRSAERTVNRILPLLTSAHTLRFAFVPEGQDPDDLIKQRGKPGMDMVLNQARSMIDIVWELARIKFGRSLNTPEEHSAFRAGLRYYTSLIKDDNLRKLYNDDINKRLQQEKERVWQERKNPRAGSARSGAGHHNDNTLILARRQPPSPNRLREKTLLAIMINYPTLFDEFGEELAQISFTAPEFEALRQRLVDILSLDSHEPLDEAGFYSHLCDESGMRPAGLDDVVSESTYIHAAFARPGRDVGQARQGWKSIWDKHVQEQLRADLQIARRRYAEDASEDNLTRLMALRQNVESMLHDADALSLSLTKES
jgi:DNA primase